MSRLVLLLSFLWVFPAFGQTAATISFTPQAGDGQKTIFGLDDCPDLDTEQDFFTVDISFSLGTPPLGSTYSIFLGTACDGNDACQVLAEDEPLLQNLNDLPISFSLQTLLDALELTSCENTDEKLKIFVDVNDVLGTLIATGTTEDTESIFLDTIRPENPVNLAASGGENVLHVTWDSNTENTDSNFVLGNQEASFQALCRFADTTDDFVACGPEVLATASSFAVDIDSLNGEALENGVSIEVGIVTIDPAGNESVFDPTSTVVASPQDVLDFGENYNGVEQGGFCMVSPTSVPSSFVFFLCFAAVLFLRLRGRR